MVEGSGPGSGVRVLGFGVWGLGMTLIRSKERLICDPNLSIMTLTST